MVALVILMACNGPPEKPGPYIDTDGIDPADTADTAIPEPLIIPVFSTGPAVAMSTNVDAPLWGMLTAQTDIPTQLTVEFAGSLGTSVRTYEDFSTDHSQVLIGLAADDTTTLTISVTSEAGAVATWGTPIEITTDPLPIDFPILLTTVAKASEMEPGLTLVASSSHPTALTETAYAFMIDSAGTVLWYYHDPIGMGRARMTDDGSLVFQRDRESIVEVDLTGQVLGVWHGTQSAAPAGGSIQVDVDLLHGEALKLPNDNLLALAVETRTISDYPTSESDILAPTADAEVVGDIIVEFQPDGTIVREHKLLDLLQSTRIGYGSVSSTYWTDWYGSERKDWAHAVSLDYLASHDYVLVTLYNQDAVACIELSTGVLQWMIAPPINWSPEFTPLILDPLGNDPVFHPVGARFTPLGGVALFDTQTWGANAYQEPLDPLVLSSRAVQFDINAFRLEQEISSRFTLDANENFSPTYGDMQVLHQTGNSLVTYGHIPHNDDSKPQARVIEADGNVVVFQLGVMTPDAVVHSAMRIPSP